MNRKKLTSKNHFAASLTVLAIAIFPFDLSSLIYFTKAFIFSGFMVWGTYTLLHLLEEHPIQLRPIPTCNYILNTPKSLTNLTAVYLILILTIVGAFYFNQFKIINFHYHTPVALVNFTALCLGGLIGGGGVWSWMNKETCNS